MKRTYTDRQEIRAALRRSFAKGVGSIFSLRGSDIEPPRYPHRTAPRLSPAARDARALSGDWHRVGLQLFSHIK